MNLETKRLIYSYYNPPYNHENKYAHEKEILVMGIFSKNYLKIENFKDVRNLLFVDFR